MIIVSERAELERAGVPACRAEVIVEDQSGERPVMYSVNAALFDIESFCVGKTSIFDEDVDDYQILEEYESLEDTKKSSFAPYFEIVARMIDELGCSSNG